ncbi:hypothetical protein [Burkholderia perseverans]|uniref:hypothetical protein n=1 Tax=Burkholderia perseverans TaxID=2615214 RepID=UPI001FEE5BAC|nr:hypothetical protein [Burkholderia perseverans]
MKDAINNIAIGLGVAALGFALVKYFQGGAGAAPAGAGSVMPINMGTTSGGGNVASWQSLTFPLGTNTGGVNVGSLDQVYSSTSWNPDSISAQIGADTLAAMGALGMSTANQYGFHL